MFGGVIQTSLKPVDGSDSMQSKDALTNEYYECEQTWCSHTGSSNIGSNDNT